MTKQLDRIRHCLLLAAAMAVLAVCTLAVTAYADVVTAAQNPTINTATKEIFLNGTACNISKLTSSSEYQFTSSGQAVVFYSSDNAEEVVTLPTDLSEYTIYGGFENAASSVQSQMFFGSSSTSIASMSFKAIYGGSKNCPAGETDAMHTSIAIEARSANLTVTDGIYGGGYGENTTCTVDSFDIIAGNITGNLYFGAYYGNAAVAGGTMSIKGHNLGTTVTGNIFGGSRHADFNAANTSNRLIDISECTITGSVYGGCETGNFTPSSRSSWKSIYICPTNGTKSIDTRIDGNIYGGCKEGNYNGNCLVTIERSTSDYKWPVNITGTVYSSCESGNVTGTSAVNITSPTASAQMQAMTINKVTLVAEGATVTGASTLTVNTGSTYYAPVIIGSINAGTGTAASTAFDLSNAKVTGNISGNSSALKAANSILSGGVAGCSTVDLNGYMDVGNKNTLGVVLADITGQTITSTSGLTSSSTGITVILPENKRSIGDILMSNVKSSSIKFITYPKRATGVSSQNAMIVDPTRIALQPTNQSSTYGSRTTYTISMTYSTALNYTYRWQFQAGSRWVTFSEDSARTSQFTFTALPVYNGLTIRCLVTAETGDSVASNAVTYTMTGLNYDTFTSEDGVSFTSSYLDPRHPIDVQARHISTGDKVYKVDIEWGSMQFEYTFNTGGEWNPDTHSYSEVTGAWNTAKVDGANNRILVTNHSNDMIYAYCAYATDQSFNVNGNAAPVLPRFFDNNTDAVSAAQGLNATDVDANAVESAETDNMAHTTEFYFTYSGTPDISLASNFSDYVNSGTITVSIISWE